jgi:hypothetical protein
LFRAVDSDPDPVPDMDPGTDLIWIQCFDDQKQKKKNTAEIFFTSFFDQKLQFTYVQTTGEAVSLKKRTSSTSKIVIY